VIRELRWCDLRSEVRTQEPFACYADYSVGEYDYATIHRIVDTTPVLHVSFPPTGDDPFPAVLPMLGCTGTYSPDAQAAVEQSHAPGSFPNDDEEEDYSTGPRSIYVHGHAASRLFKTPGEDKIPVCVAATSMQGIVLALTPFHNSCNYASAIVHGYASVVTSEEERLYALTRITDNLVVCNYPIPSEHADAVH
jgi:uncharacterized protein